MEAEVSRGVRLPSFGFALDCPEFSDKVLRIEVVASDAASVASDTASVASDAASGSSLRGGPPDDSARPFKRRREELHDEEGHNDSSVNMPGTPILRVKIIHVCAAILAGSSPFFKKLFMNGMKESHQKEVTLRVTQTEEIPLQELLSFMYSGELTATDPVLLVNVLVIADKFEVLGCITHCCEILRRLPMTTERALLHLDLECSILVAAVLEPAKAAAKEFLANKYKDFMRLENEVMGISLSGLKAIISSSDLMVPSEDYIFDFLLKWACAQYPDLGERCKMLSSLLPFVRFNHMTCGKLQHVLNCPDIDQREVLQTVIFALFYKADSSRRQRAIDAAATPWKYEERAYLRKPVKVMEFRRPFQQCIVYMDLKIDDCTKLFPNGRISSQGFYFAHHGFFLSAACNMQPPGLHSFGLFLGLENWGLMPFTMQCEFSARARPSGDFLIKYKYTHTFTENGGNPIGIRNLFSIPWARFVDDSSNPFFIDGMLYIRAVLTVMMD